MNFQVAAGLATAAVLAAGCGSAAASHPAVARQSASAQSTRAAPWTCSTTLRPIVAILAADQRRQDKTFSSDWWVGGGRDQSDLQAAINATASAPISSDAAQFNQAAQQYLNDQTPYLSPGWQSEADAIRRDLHQLARDCGITPGFRASVPWN